MKAIVKIIIILLHLTYISGCSNFQSNKSTDLAGYVESGTASFYADKHQSRKTANGELYQHRLNTAAHRTLPFGAIVKVTNLENGKSVLVKINDRGPFAKGRIIDLSKSAFSTIANPSSGVVGVRIEVVK
jgi:rare lipoprotein A